MFLESFRHLIEIEALKRDNQVNQQRINSENKRISDIEERRKKSLASIEELKIEEKNLKVTETLNQIEDKQIRLTKLEGQLALSATQKEQNAFENQISILKDEIKDLENHYFEKLDQSERHLLEIDSLQTFYQGSDSTLKDIKAEVAALVSKEELIIQNRQVRIDALLDMCQISVKKLYLELQPKFYPKSPISYLLDKKCSGCHMLLDSQMRSSLEEGRSLELCPTCSRLIIPETAKIY
ncbi:MAG: hypothetical protein HOP07_08295 [Bacteriovoracaceae bacterium]|nr:hypothetical protein [Bacteriovoracaceae bacterium]